MIDAVYNEKILEFAGNITRIGHLEAPDGVAKAHSKLCGSTVLVEINIVNDGNTWRISDYAHDVKACALGQASSSVVAANVIGASVDVIRQTREIFTKMLKEEGDPPTGRFEDLKYLEPVREYKARHASTLLVFDALVEAIEEAERKSSAA